MQKISSLDQFNLDMQNVFESHDLIKCHTHFYQDHQKL